MADENQVGIILRDYKGNETVHYGKERLEVDTTDGGTVGFVREDLVADSGGGNTTAIVQEPEWIDDICFWDYDGTLLLNISVADVQKLTELPTPPEHDGLVFLEWNYTLEEIQEAGYPVDVGACYMPADGKTHVVLNITDSSYRDITVYFTQDTANAVTIDWGDGNVSSGFDASVSSTTHTYSAIGQYEIVISVEDGHTMTIGGGTAGTGFIGGSSNTYRNYVTEVYFGRNIAFSKYTIYWWRNAEILTLPSDAASIPGNCIQVIDKLKALIVPRSVKSIDGVGSLGSYSTRIKTTVSLPATLKTLGTNSLDSLYYAERLVIPPQITTVPYLNNLYTAKRVFMSDDVMEIGTGPYNCYNLRKFDIPGHLVSVGNWFLSNCHCIHDVVLPETLTTVGNYFCDSDSIRRLVVKGLIETVGKSPLSGAIGEIIFYQEKPGAGISELLNDNAYMKVYVPDAAVDAYKDITSSDYYMGILPLSEYRGTLPN